MKKFVFLIHPRVSAKEDMGKVSSLFRIFPENVLRQIGKYLPPVVRGKVKFSGSDEIIGWIIVIPLVGEQFFSLPKDFVVNKILQSIQKVEKLGVKIVGLGEFISSITKGGKELVGKISPEITITNGNSLTTGVIFKSIEKISEIKKIDLSREKVAIIGAGGSVGRGASFLFAERNIPLILIEKKDKISELRKTFSFLVPNNITISDDISLIKEAKIVVVITASTQQIIKPTHLKERAIIYDITQPRNTSINILKERNDVLIIDGGIFNTPTIDYGMDIGLKEHQAYACLVETIIFALEGIEENYVGYPSSERVKKMLKLIEEYQDCFKLNIFQSFGRLLNNKLEITS